MKISRTPYRISLFGGSTDYESYYSKNGSLLIGFTIDSYCYVATRFITPVFEEKFILQYSKTEKVFESKDIQNNAFRGVIQFLDVDKVEIHFLTDLPSQTGVGSSSSCIVGTLNALYTLYGKTVSKKQLSDEAITIERKNLKEPGGIQDQIWAAYGGMNSIEVKRDGSFFVRPLSVSSEFKQELKETLLLFYTGGTRQSFELAASHDKETIYKKNIHHYANKALSAFEDENIYDIGKLLHETWIAKKSISDNISSIEIDKIYEYAINNGAIGGKLLGSGQKGFMAFIVIDKQEKFIEKMQSIGLRHINYNYDNMGSEIIL